VFDLKPFNPDDFLTYQLRFELNLQSQAPMFMKYLNKVLPDVESQNVLAEFIGYVFAKNLKLEKCLLLYGSGANGKSVFFDIINALLGRDSITNFPLESFSEDHNRAMIANKLLNYGSEINGNLDSNIFKQLVSNEPINCRFKYGNPFISYDYARLIFNCNELPRQVEINTAYFRRFIIVPFDVTIPEDERNPELAKQIIATELSGIFNWVLDGLTRILVNKKFTISEKVQRVLNDYQEESDSVMSYLLEEGLEKSVNTKTALKSLYGRYKSLNQEEGRMSLSIKRFSKRLRNLGFQMDRENTGMMVYVQSKNGKMAFDNYNNLFGSTFMPEMRLTRVHDKNESTFAIEFTRPSVDEDEIELPF